MTDNDAINPDYARENPKVGADSLVDRLRKEADEWEKGFGYGPTCRLLREAATRIETLELADPYFAAGFLWKLKAECEAQHARAEAAEAKVETLEQALASQKGRNKDLERRIRKELEPTVEKLYAELAQVRQKESQLHAMPDEDY